MLQRIFKRANRRCFMVSEYDLEALAENVQYDLFHNSCSTDHCLNHLYTSNRKPAGSMQLRHRGHNFALPTIQLEFNKRHFVARVLFDNVWCVSHVGLALLYYLRPIFNSFLISITLYLCVWFVMFLLCKHDVRVTCGFLIWWWWWTDDDDISKSCRRILWRNSSKDEIFWGTAWVTGNRWRRSSSRCGRKNSQGILPLCDKDETVLWISMICDELLWNFLKVEVVSLATNRFWYRSGSGSGFRSFSGFFAIAR